MVQDTARWFDHACLYVAGVCLWSYWLVLPVLAPAVHMLDPAILGYFPSRDVQQAVLWTGLAAAALWLIRATGPAAPRQCAGALLAGQTLHAAVLTASGLGMSAMVPAMLPPPGPVLALWAVIFLSPLACYGVALLAWRRSWRHLSAIILVATVLPVVVMLFNGPVAVHSQEAYLAEAAAVQPAPETAPDERLSIDNAPVTARIIHTPMVAPAVGLAAAFAAAMAERRRETRGADRSNDGD